MNYFFPPVCNKSTWLRATYKAPNVRRIANAIDIGYRSTKYNRRIYDMDLIVGKVKKKKKMYTLRRMECSDSTTDFVELFIDLSG